MQWPPWSAQGNNPGAPGVSIPRSGMSVPVSVYGVAIGPQSTVDRAYLSFNLDKIPAAQIGFGAFQTLNRRLRRITVDAPLFYAQRSNPNKGVTAAQNGGIDVANTPEPITTLIFNGALYVFPMSGISGSANDGMSTAVPPNYLRGITPFTATNMDDGSIAASTGLITPRLHLLFFLKPISILANKRNPLIIHGGRGGLANGVETVLAQIPVFGRNTIHLMMRSDGASPATLFRAGFLRIGDPLGQPQEWPIQTIASPGVNTPAVFAIPNPAKADFLNLYINSATLNANVIFEVAAYD
jgi:hypothetical protein